MDLEGVLLSEIRQTNKDRYHIILLMCVEFKNTKLTNTENRLWYGWQRWEKGEGTKFSYTINSGDARYSWVMTVHSTVLHVQKLLKELIFKVPIIQKKL